VYPDCRPEFIQAASRCAALGTAGHGDVEITAPFVTMTKGEIARHGLRLGAPLELSWSCYKGGERPCGTCGTCTERAEAFALAGAPDPAILEAGR
jgi:7-cyano-7-deazaguanine synthase